MACPVQAPRRRLLTSHLDPTSISFQLLCQVGVWSDEPEPMKSEPAGFEEIVGQCLFVSTGLWQAALYRPHG